MNTVVSNEFLELELDASGNVQSFRNRKTGTRYAGRYGWWRLVFGTDSTPELEMRAEHADGRVSAGEGSFRIDYDFPVDHTGVRRDVRVAVTGVMKEDELHLSIDLENRMEENMTIRECHFPVIRLTPEAEAMSYHQSENGGMVWPSLAQHRHCLSNAGALYQSMDYLYSRRLVHYPHSHAGTNCFALNNGREGLYFGCHDPSFEITGHITELETQDDAVNLSMVKLPFIAPGKSRSYGNFILSLHEGRWHRAADKYRKWIENHVEIRKARPEVAVMNGWQRLIMRSQFGELFYRFDRMPQIFADGIKAGIDTLFLFGWHQGGHDCDYPNYVVSDELGGEEALRENIAKFHALGGRVIFYANGQLIDRAGDFYRNGNGKKVCSKDIRGCEYSEVWGFSGHGIFNRRFGGRSFARSCPTSREWTEIMKKFIDLAVRLGGDGVFFDQLGVGDPICCDPTHGHPVPFTGVMAARRAMLDELREYAHAKGVSFGIEQISDLTALSADYIHSWPGGSTVVNPDWEKRCEKPCVDKDFSWFRYIFPEIFLSNREIRDDQDIERRVNRILLSGIFSDVEIYRCQRTIAETPHYQEYLGKANAFRRRNMDVYSTGRFRSDSMHEIDSAEADSNGFELPDGSLAVVVTQSHLERLDCRVSVSGKSPVSADFLGDGKLQPNGTLTLGRHGLALLRFRAQ